MEVLNISSHPVLFPSEIASLVRVKKLNENAVMPTQGSEWSAGWDLYACIDEPVCIYPSCTVKIGIGLSIELPKYTFGAIVPRSGLSTKKGLRPANTPGTCDSDYRGEYIIAVHNDSNTGQMIHPGERIAQLVLMPYCPMEFVEVKELDSTERGDGGFGSTGLN